MLAVLSEDFIERDLAQLPDPGHLRVSRIERRGHLVLAWMLARERSEVSDHYLLRLDCTGYPERAPDAEFLDPSTETPSPLAWPRDYQRFDGQGWTQSIFRSGNMPPFVCAPPFLAWQTHGHPRPTPDEWQLEHALTAVAVGLNAPEYAGYNR